MTIPAVRPNTAAPVELPEALANETLRAVFGVLGLANGMTPEVMQRKTTSARELLEAFGPRDSIEHAFAAQAVSCHVAGMMALARATDASLPPEVASRLRRDATRLFNGMVDMGEAIERRRGKRAHQVVRVEHVSIEAGAQAVIGAVVDTRPGGGA